MENMYNIEYPYPGLRPFTWDEQAIFHGRDDQIQQLLEKLHGSRFISVVGLSGCGKSSLVRAGLIPKLEMGYLVNAGRHWRIATMRPGDRPMERLAEALLDKMALGMAYARGAATQSDACRFLLAELERHQYSLADLVLREMPLPKGTNLLIVVDQFEELFRYHREGQHNPTEAFVNLLLKSAAQDDAPIYVVTTMRSDFIGDCALFSGLPEVMNKGQFLVPRLTHDQQEEAIIRPLELFGGTIDADLVNALLNEMGHDPDQLPLLQHCLMRIWNVKMAQSDSEEVRFSAADYEAVGGLKHALSKHADEVFGELDDNGRRVAETLFRCLTERDLRRPAQLQEVVAVACVPESNVITVVDAFRHPDRCFLTPAANVPLTVETMIDISHESLIRQWERMNKWVSQEARSAWNYQSLESRAYKWKQSNCDPKWLWEGIDLDIRLDWQQKEKPTPDWALRYGGDFATAMEFLDACQGARDEKRRQEERAKEEKRQLEEHAREEKRQLEEQARAEKQRLEAQASEEKHQHEEHERQLKLKHARQWLVGVVTALVIAISLAGWALVERGNAQKLNVQVTQSLKETQTEREKAEKANIDLAQSLKQTQAAQAATEKALQEAKEQRLLAVAETQAKEEARTLAEQKRIEAVNAQKLAEDQKQAALAARADAEQKQQEAEQARREAEKQRQFALVETAAKEDALKLAENARMEAEQQKQLAVAEKARADQNNVQFQTMAFATFAFLANSSKTTEFMAWAKSQDMMNDLRSAWPLMIDSSNVADTQKKYWHNMLSEAELPIDLVSTLAMNALQNIKNKNLIFTPMYVVSAGGSMPIFMDLPPLTIEIGEPKAIHGKVVRAKDDQTKLIYTAPPDLPANEDIVTVVIKNNNGQEQTRTYRITFRKESE